ncbi:Os11g0467966 [Oryza sativa Japonica Group]|uniref:Os11g0467966 protein n=1 Tax=Oryza sativa subsp. japonica TaxID=39947 RepID=A0A0N7KSW8_ORYSJ|nr:Os11g0467966 [Oryza sativa Japonica Group]
MLRNPDSTFTSPPPPSPRHGGAPVFGHPLGGGDGAAERDKHVAPPESPHHLVGGHRDVPGPAGASAVRRLHARHGGVRR